MELPPALNLPEERRAIPPPRPIKDSPFAITSLVTALLGWTLIPILGSVVAIITGHLAKKEIRESGGYLGGNSMATAGLILGYIQIGFVLLVAIGLIVVLLLARQNNWIY